MGQSQSLSARRGRRRDRGVDRAFDASGTAGIDPRADLRAHARATTDTTGAPSRSALASSSTATAGGGTNERPERDANENRGTTRETTTIRSHVNVNKATITCVTGEDVESERGGDTAKMSSTPPPGVDANKFGVRFKLDCDEACRVTVAYVARELPRVSGKGAFEPASTNPIARTNPKSSIVAYVEAGLGATFSQSVEDFIDARSFGGLSELTTSNANESKIYPCVIRLECVQDDAGGTRTLADLPEVPNGGLAPLEPWVQAQTTYVEFERAGDASAPKWSARCVKQKIWVKGASYELQEIYGIVDDVHNGLNGARGGNPDDDLCVICLTEPRNTTVLPCRHLCMCAECAHHLRLQGSTGNVCPICRNPVESLLEIKVSEVDASDASVV